MEVISLEEAEEYYREWELAAFQSWNNLVQNWQRKKSPPDFEAYKKQLGIKRPGKFINKSKQAELEEANTKLMDLGLGIDLNKLKPQIN